MYDVYLGKHFKTQLKKLARKDPTLVGNLSRAIKTFNPRNAISIARHIYKVRLPSVSGGKSGGFRLYIYILEYANILAPIWIYKKNKVANLSMRDLLQHLSKTKQDLEQSL